LQLALKPTNVLVTLQDGTPLVKVIDFGIAKALGQQLTDKTLFTGFAQLIGTPLYMAPEQAALSNVDVDTRSDIYSLGVLLYELLTGTTPLDKERLKGVDFAELRRIIREEEPPRPSTRISTLGQAATAVSTQRKSDPKRLSQLFRGELDWIVMKALEKDRDRRYETASAFAQDVQRYLHDEPVQACPPSAWYRFRKFARRNKAKLAGAGLILFFIVILGIGAVWYQQDQAARGAALAARQADTERSVTAALTQAQTLVDEGDKQIDHPERWQATARLAKAALEKAEELLRAGAGTDELAGRVRQVRAAVDAAVTDSRLLVKLDHIWLEQAAVKENRFDNARAAPLYAKLLENYGVDPAMPEAAAARVRDSRLREALLAALADWSRVSPDEGERQRLAKVYQLALPSDSLRQRLMAAVSRRDSAKVAKLVAKPSFHDVRPTSVVLLAQGLGTGKAWAAAELLLRAGLERHPGDFWLNHELGMLLKNQQPPRPEEAVRYLATALALRPDSPGVHLNLGNALDDTGDREGAIRRYRAALWIDPMFAMAHNNLGGVLLKKGDTDGAIAKFRKAIRLKKDYPSPYENLARALFDKGRLGKAIAACREALRLKPDFPEAHDTLGAALGRQGRLDEAIAEFRKALRLRPDVPGYHTNLAHTLRAKGKLGKAIAECRVALRLKPDFPEAHNILGAALADQGRLDEAIAEFRRALASKQPYRKAYEAHGNLGFVLRAKGRLDEAIAEFKVAILLKKDDPKVHTNLGDALAAKGRPDEAIAEFRETLGLKGDDPLAHYGLGTVLAAKGRTDEAIAEYQEALRLMKDYPEAHTNLGLALDSKGRLDEAIAEYREALASKQPFPEAYKAHHNLGNALLAKGRLGEAIAECRAAIRLKKDYPGAHYSLGIALLNKGQLDEALAEFTKANELDPKLPVPLNHLAWAFATHPNAKVRNPRQAVALAQKAVQAAPKQGAYWKTLGVAQYRAGDPKAALAALTKSMELSKGGDGYVGFILAMAHYQLGEKEKARQWFDRAVQWMEQKSQALKKNPQQAEELRRFRDEAEEVLKLKKK
jgi:tetratricopeptide (TPR) repeat protein